MKPLRLRVVRSSLNPALVSLRTLGALGAAGSADIRGALTAAGYLPGDIVELTVISRLGDRDTKEQS